MGSFSNRGTALFFQFRKYHDLNSVQRSLTKQIFEYDRRVVDESTVMNSMKSLIELRSHSNSTESEQVTNLFTRVSESPNVELSNDFILKVIRELNPPSEFIIQLFKVYNARYPESCIKQEVASLGLFKSLYDKVDLNHAMEIVKLTTGSSNYINVLRSQRNMSVFKYFSGGLLGLGSFDVALRALDFNPTVGIYAMCLTYVFNVLAFGFLSFGERFVPIVDHIEFEPGTSTNERYLHSDEMRMLSKIAEVDIMLNGVEGFVSRNFAESIAGKSLVPVQPESDILIQEYWLSGGNNFEWMEPDQDPADILWRQRIEGQKPTLLNDLKWTDKLIEGETIPNSTQLKEV